MAGRDKNSGREPLVAVVDDDEDVRIALKSLLASLDYGTETFETADSLLASPEIGRFDCIISDVQMPGTNGLQLAERISPSRAPVILITAFPTEAIGKRAEAAGVHCLLSKPFDVDVLIDELAALLD